MTPRTGDYYQKTRISSDVTGLNPCVVTIPVSMQVQGKPAVLANAQDKVEIFPSIPNTMVTQMTTRRDLNTLQDSKYEY